MSPRPGGELSDGWVHVGLAHAADLIARRAPRGQNRWPEGSVADFFVIQVKGRIRFGLLRLQNRLHKVIEADERKKRGKGGFCTGRDAFRLLSYDFCFRSQKKRYIW
jgi:hypothetical protein